MYAFAHHFPPPDTDQLTGRFPSIRKFQPGRSCVRDHDLKRSRSQAVSNYIVQLYVSLLEPKPRNVLTAAGQMVYVAYLEA